MMPGLFQPDDGAVAGQVNPYGLAIDSMKRLLEIPRYQPPPAPRPHWPDFVNDYFGPDGNLYPQYSQPHQYGGMIRNMRDDLNAAQVPNYTPLLERSLKDAMHLIPGLGSISAGANVLNQPPQQRTNQPPTVAGQTWDMLKMLLGQ